MNNPFRLRFAVVVAVSLAVISSAGREGRAQALGASSLQKLLTEQNAGWRAAENWVTRLPAEQVHRMMGLQNPPSVDAQFSALETADAADVPASLDWRAKDGVNWITPILNQGNCGSCVAFAAVGVLESQVNITSGIPGLNPAFSTQALFACGGGACDYGWRPESAERYLTRSGVPDEACAPYTMGSTGVDVACSSICSDSKSRSLRLVRSNAATQGTRDINAVKRTLQHGPVVTTMTVYADFISYAGGVYKHVTGSSQGGHAVSIVGYNTAERYWIVRNSWGGDWGENGFVRISWDDRSGVGSETWSYEVPQTDGYVSVRNPHGRQFVTGSLPLVAESTFPQTRSVDLELLTATSRVKLASCDRTPCAQNLDTSSLPNGRYEVRAVANWGTGQSTVSAHEQFFVFNGMPALSLSYSVQDDVSLSRPLKGRLVFELDSSTGSTDVPMSQVTLHVADSTGKEVQTKSSSLVLSKMTLGWRSNSVPNGQYQIWFTGSLVTSAGKLAEVSTSRVTVTTKN